MIKTTATADHSPRAPRLTASERRDAIVVAAMDEFAAKGLTGASVDVIAHAAGVSQPYVYQLFGSKRDLFLAVVRHGFERTRVAFEDTAARYARGEIDDCGSVLGAMGIAYIRLLQDRTLLLIQLQAYAACADPVVRDAVRGEFGRLHRYVARATGATPDEIHHFFAEGMLLNIGAAVRLDGEPLGWTLDQLGGAD